MLSRRRMMNTAEGQIWEGISSVHSSFCIFQTDFLSPINFSGDQCCMEAAVTGVWDETVFQCLPLHPFLNSNMHLLSSDDSITDPLEPGRDLPSCMWAKPTHRPIVWRNSKSTDVRWRSVPRWALLYHTRYSDNSGATCAFLIPRIDMQRG